MHRVAQRGVALRLHQPARLIAGRRFRPLPARIPSSAQSRSLSIFPQIPNSSNEDPNARDDGPQNDPITPGSFSVPSPNGQGNGSAKNGSQGSTSRRWRSRKSRDLPPIQIPGWFLDNNVKLIEEANVWNSTPLEVVSDGAQSSSAENAASSEDAGEQKTGHPEKEGENIQAEPEDITASTSSIEDTGHKSYRIHQSVLSEIQACLSGGLSSSRPESMDTFAGGKTHLKLYCPVDGATYFLEKSIEHVAQGLDADIVRLDAQDLAEIAGDYIKEGADATNNSLWSLGYDVQNALPKPPPPFAPPAEQYDGSEEGDEYGMDDYEERDGRPPKQHTMTGLTAIPLATFPMVGGSGGGDLAGLMERIRKSFQGGGAPSPQASMSPSGSSMPGVIPVNQLSQANSSLQWNDHKLSALLEILVDANVAKRSGSQPSKESGIPDSSEAAAPSSQGVVVLPPEPEQSNSEGEGHSVIPQLGSASPKTILLIRGYKELHSTDQGRLILEKLVDIVQKKRKAGQPTVIVGVSASSSLTPDISHNALVDLQNDGQTSVLRTVVVLPAIDKGAIFRDGPRHIRAVNVRHIHTMVQRLFRGSGISTEQDLDGFAWELNQSGMSTEASATLDSQLLGFDEVHRISLTALGLQLQNPAEKNASHAVATAMQMLEKSDDARSEWAHSEQQVQKPASESSKAKSHTEARLKKLKKQCDHHERQLLKGVVHTENIRTTFEHVHAPAETVESLKNLTMLSLTRPDAFKYGVLATDKITGCLLYGPPGTGKTLLAKAVAKESGATVLEVSGSDVYDMYVGESEKNVRAIFSLAKKLSPCVVFIDEADAIFASRGSGTNRNSHRELINQFLREWDGMTDTNAFIMVATNRPFDLDDAALRRLPRRLLVDLPTERDREAILRIHLKEEALDAAISIPDLASRTSLYSGSDLKNMCVAAALNAVKEEYDMATKHNEEKEEEDPAFEYPERRTLQQRHFEKAMEEITASVSEDMSSLGAIRKFDEKYGDRRGKKKRGGYGFTSGGEGQREETAKVRS